MHAKVLSGPKLHQSLPETGLGVELFNTLRKHFSEDPNRKALIDAKTSESLSYQEVWQKTVQLAQALQNAGYKESDVIAIYSENNLDFILPAIASFYLGIVVTTVNFSYSELELKHALSISKPKLVFVSPTVYHKLDNVINQKDLPWIKEVVLINCPFSSPHSRVLTLNEFVRNFNGYMCNAFRPKAVDCRNHLAGILFSSGTTGLPKGVMLSHENFLTRLIHACDPRYNEVLPKQTKLNILPLFHGYGLLLILADLNEGHTSVLMCKFQLEDFLKCIEQYRIKFLYIIPPIIILLSKSPLVDKYDLTSLKKIFCGAAPLDRKVESLVKNRLNIKEFYQGYGLTEATHATMHFPFPAPLEKQGSIGIILPALSAIVRDPETGIVLGPNTSGELCFKGPLVMKGYKDNEQATAESFTDDGWLLTGDIGYYDEDGYFFIVDRKKELIKYKAFQVAPAELEALLVTHPLIGDAGVIGVADEVAGEVPMAFVVRKNAELTENEVQKFVEERVSYAKRLRGGVKFVNSIPKNPSGKILRKELRILAKTLKAKL